MQMFQKLTVHHFFYSQDFAELKQCTSVGLNSLQSTVHYKQLTRNDVFNGIYSNSSTSNDKLQHTNASRNANKC